MSTKTPLQNGWYVSRDDYIDQGLNVTIYVHLRGPWTTANTGQRISETELPEAPQNMWRLNLVQR